MRLQNPGSALVSLLMLSGAALAQEGTQPAVDGPQAAEDAAGCKPAQAPGRLIITLPKEVALPACAAKNNCTKAVADQHNAGILAYNKSMSRINEATADYVDALNDYARAAGRYAQCEIDRLNEQVAAN